MPNKNQFRILLVEDDPIHARIIRSVLMSCDTRAVLSHLPDGESAVQFFAGSATAAPATASAPCNTLPDLLLLDLRLPRIDGFEVLQAIRADDRTACMPVVVVSTSDRPEDVLQSYRLGANAYLCKSPDFDVFSDRLAALCRFWRAVELPSCPA